ncbi:1106_t:CDS:2 [Paraglomus brasilianum]|uniref:1106_t:CDS:1 n=1 Tax=Paraglomus brasilianum TaxID=144538 RepID=A0A9N9FTL8_9GLOM|nr:1106_t:CDS:2 [Paraglomus brasilianum]
MSSSSSLRSIAKKLTYDATEYGVEKRSRSSCWLYIVGERVECSIAFVNLYL